MYCKNCSYDLRECQNRECSECGCSFDPDNPDTYAIVLIGSQDVLINFFVLVSTITIIGLCILGMVASLTVPHNRGPVNLIDVIKVSPQWSFKQLIDSRFCRDIGGFIFISALTTFVFVRFQSSLVRGTLSFISILIPLIYAIAVKANALSYIFLLIFSPVITYEMLAGNLDGEAWSEGLVAISAVGLWGIHWIVVSVWLGINNIRRATAKFHRVRK